jgi:hypothetical protein
VPIEQPFTRTEGVDRTFGHDTRQGARRQLGEHRETLQQQGGGGWEIVHRRNIRGLLARQVCATWVADFYRVLRESCVHATDAITRR